MPEPILLRVLRGTADANMLFTELRALLTRLGFAERHGGVARFSNMQPKAGMAKPYRVQQIRRIVVRYRVTKGV